MDDFEARFLDALYRGVLDAHELKRALDLAREMFHCLGAALVSLDAQAPALHFALTAGVFDEHGRLYVEQFAKIDPAPAVFASLQAGTASSTDRIMTVEQRFDDAFVNEFFRPIGLLETLGGNLYSDNARFSLIGLQRGRDRPQFDDDDIGKLERLMPHITRALQLRRAFFRARAEGLGLQAMVDRMATGSVLLDAEGRAIFVNAAMRAIARRGDGITLDRTGRPLFANLEARRRFDALLHDVAERGAGGLLSARRSDGARDYVVLIAPLPAPLVHVAWEASAHAGAIVLVHDPAGREFGAVEILEQALHLPRGAARVVAALAADDDLKSFAERSGITIHTARFHLRAALARTGTRSQAELVRLAVRLLRDFALAKREP
jgi:PAS domain-containing protein